MLQVFQGRRENVASPTQDLQDSQERRESQETLAVLDSQGSPVCLDPLASLQGQIFLDLWETLDFLDWMENTVFRVLQVLPALLVPARHRETEVTLGSQASPAPPVQKETPAALEALDSPAALASKVNEVSPASVEVLV